MRVCSRCGLSKPLDGFYVNRRVSRHTVCKSCKNKDKVKSRDLHPVRYLARAKVNNALANGRITREPCEVCGDSVAQAHHDDYRKPMDVRWLCKPHHREWHKTNEAAE